jgi:hypothetical protein
MRILCTGRCGCEVGLNLMSIFAMVISRWWDDTEWVLTFQQCGMVRNEGKVAGCV